MASMYSYIIVVPTKYQYNIIIIRSIGARETTDKIINTEQHMTEHDDRRARTAFALLLVVIIICTGKTTGVVSIYDIYILYHVVYLYRYHYHYRSPIRWLYNNNMLYYSLGYV